MMMANQPLEFVASFEVLPEIEKVNLPWIILKN